MSGSARRSVPGRPKSDLVPPDGGWGWVVAGAYALNNVFVLPLISGMGLVFKDTFAELNISATQGSLIINLNHGLGMLLSFFGGPLLSRIGYRSTAVGGALCVVSGVMLISVSSNFGSLLFAYSILNSTGVAAVMASFTLAINSFFKEKRSKAIGLGMSITGLGAILMPHLMNVLLQEYGWRYASLMLGALCMHSLVAALLLRPVRWYMKRPTPPDQEMQPLNKQTPETGADVEHASDARKAINGTKNLPFADSSESFFEKEEDYLDPPKQINLSMQTLNGKRTESRHNSDVQVGYTESKKSVDINEEIKTKEPQKKKKSLIKRIIHSIVVFFDLGLLKDLIFVNILVGLSIAACAEINFSLLLPFILDDMKFKTQQIAVIMSVIGLTDMVFRSLSPFIADLCRAKPRVMYLTSLGLVVITRTVMMFATTYLFMIFVALAIGATKGIRTVYMNIVIPSYVPIERLPFASGIQMLVNGCILIVFGPLLGLVKDRSGSYQLPIVILNLVTLLTVALWSSEFIYLRCKSKKMIEENEALR